MLTMPVQLISSVTGIKYTNGDGYYFRVSQKINNKLYLNCQVKSCQVRGNLSQEPLENNEIHIRGNHNHPPDFFELEFCEAECRILERAARDPSSLRKIFIEETMNVSPKTVSRLNYRSFIRRMQRRRQQSSLIASSSLDEYSRQMQTHEYQNFATIGGKKFFISTIGNNSILFISPTIRELFRHVDQTYIIYETKKPINQNMKSVLIISQVQQNVAFPLAYVAMQRRTQDDYVNVFRAILKEEPLWSPSTLFISRDQSLICAVLKIFCKCEIIPSWFHLAQELRKEIKNLDLIHLLNSDPDFYNSVVLLQNIPLLPPEFMTTGFEIVKNLVSNYILQPGVSQLFEFVSEKWLLEPTSSRISLFGKLEKLKVELKLMHRQFMSSFRASARKDVIWSFTKGLITFESKYADAYRELLVSNVPPKWTAHHSCKSQEKKMNSLMELFANAKLTVESFLEQSVKVGITLLDMMDHNSPEMFDDESSVDQTETMAEVDNVNVDEEYADFDEYIVEEVEECIENDDDSGSNLHEISETKVDLNHEDESCQNEKQTFMIQKPSKKRFKQEKCVIEDDLVFLATPVKQTSSSNVDMPHACVKCKTSIYSFACQPCGHLCLCNLCCSGMIQKTCPICAKVVLWLQEIIPATPFNLALKFE